LNENDDGKTFLNVVYHQNTTNILAGILSFQHSAIPEFWFAFVSSA
jgi:hypothetical protein